MNFEISPPENTSAEKGKDIVSRREDYDRQLIAACEAATMFNLGKVEVRGLDNLDKISRDERVIIATSHISDMDIPVVVAKLGRRLNPIVSNQSFQHEFSKSALPNIAMRIAGEENFVPIDYDVETGKPSFNPKNFEAIQKDKRNVVVAAHNPTDEWELPDKGGYGAVYLAEISGATILPVAVDIKSEEKVGMGPRRGKMGETIKIFLKSVIRRPDTDVVIGEPIKLEKIDGLERFSELMDIKKQRRLNKEELGEFKNLSDKLRERSAEVMTALAHLLPKEKQGRWGDL